MDYDKALIEALERIATALERIAHELEPGPHHHAEPKGAHIYETLWDQLQGIRRRSNPL
jgi:hypothetical protein